MHDRFRPSPRGRTSKISRFNEADAERRALSRQLEASQEGRQNHPGRNYFSRIGVRRKESPSCGGSGPQRTPSSRAAAPPVPKNGSGGPPGGRRRPRFQQSLDGDQGAHGASPQRPPTFRTLFEEN